MTENSMCVIRKGTVSDAALLTELGARTFSETFAADNTEEDMAQYLATSFNAKQQHAELIDPLTTFLIAEIGAVAAGYAMLRVGLPPDRAETDESIELVRFYVCKEWYGRSVGKMLMQACLDEARRQRHLILWLGVWEHNSRARAFYRKWRFEEFGQHIFQLGGDPENDILMRRQTAATA